jgi:CheY-like chemotaxis protein
MAGSVSVELVSSSARAWRGEHAAVVASTALAAGHAAGKGNSDGNGNRVLGVLLAEVLPPLELQAAQRIVTVQSDLRPEDLERPVVDPAALRALLRRVLANAVDHNVVGGLVWFGVSGQGAEAMLTVADTGVGMNDDDAAALQATLGHGAMVQSVLGAGTRVHVRLQSASLPTAHQHDGLAPAAEPEGTVLCVEDHDVDFYLVEEALARWPKVQVLHAASVRAGLELISTLRPAVTLLDMRLADGTGLDVLRPIRGNPATAGLPIFMLSADALPHQMRAAFEAGADGYWTKPLDIEGFLAKMEELLLRSPADCSVA